MPAIILSPSLFYSKSKIRDMAVLRQDKFLKPIIDDMLQLNKDYGKEPKKLRKKSRKK